RGYREASGSVGDVPDALKAAAGKATKDDETPAPKAVDPRKGGDASHKLAEGIAAKAASTSTTPASAPAEEVGTEYSKKYRGISFKLVVTGDGYRLVAPTGHELDRTLHSSPTAAAKALTGWTAVNGRKFFGMTAGAKVARAPGTPKAKPAQGVKVDDPRLPSVGETIHKDYGGAHYEMVRLRDAEGRDFYVVSEIRASETKAVGTFSSVSAAASEIAGCQENGHRFFHLDSGVPAMDPWMLVARLCEDMTPEVAMRHIGTFGTPSVEDATDFANKLARLDYKERTIAHAKTLTAEANALVAKMTADAEAYAAKASA
ncbi:MAG TPA: hypothetical protein VMX57_07655, partial [Planctomycetota bacterium]|nr:hypothetical protein [Planctomycetota bacterium]